MGGSGYWNPEAGLSPNTILQLVMSQRHQQDQLQQERQHQEMELGTKLAADPNFDVSKAFGALPTLDAGKQNFLMELQKAHRKATAANESAATQGNLASLAPGMDPSIRTALYGGGAPGPVAPAAATQSPAPSPQSASLLSGPGASPAMGVQPMPTAPTTAPPQMPLSSFARQQANELAAIAAIPDPKEQRLAMHEFSTNSLAVARAQAEKTREDAKAASEIRQRTFTDSMSLRKEYDMNPVTAKFLQVREGLRGASSVPLTEKDGATKTTDNVLIASLGRATFPSRFTQGEFQMMQQTGTLNEQLDNYIQQLMGANQKISDKQRRYFFDTVKKLYGVAQREQATNESFYTGLSKKSGFDPRDIVQPYSQQPVGNLTAASIIPPTPPKGVTLSHIGQIDVP